MNTLFVALAVGASPGLLVSGSTVAESVTSTTTVAEKLIEASTAAVELASTSSLAGDTSNTSSTAVQLAEPKSSAVTPVALNAPARTSFWDQLRFTALVSSTLRWQIDNGDRTVPIIPNPVTGEPTRNNSWDPTGEDFGDFITTVGGSVGYENFLLAARFDTALYFHKPTAAPDASELVKKQLQDRYVNLFRVEYIAATYTSKKLNIVLGDSNMTLGRGMILSLRKVGDVGVDNKLRGAKAGLRLGGFRAQAFGGWVNGKNYETGTGFYYPERLVFEDQADTSKGRPYEANDFVSGGRIAYRYKKYIEVGAHSAYIQSPTITSPTGEQVQARILGTAASVELPRPVKWLSAYLELAHLRRDDSSLNDSEFRGLLTDGIETGTGLYGSTSLYFGPATFLIEGKYYDNMFNVFPRGIRQPINGVVNRYSEPPTAERPQTILLANNTVHGGRARFDYRIAPGISPYLSFGVYRDDSFSNSLSSPNGLVGLPTNIWALFGGGRFSFGHTELLTEMGYRAQTNDLGGLGPITGSPAEQERERIRRRDVDGSIFRNDLHLLVDWVQPIWGPLSTEFVINGLYAIQGIGAEFCGVDGELPEVCNGMQSDRFEEVRDEWFEGRVALSVKSSDGWGVTGAWEFYTRQPQRFDQHYFSFGGQWEFKKGSILRALYGGERAGLKCSGGVCRFFPGFEGGRLELVVRL